MTVRKPLVLIGGTTRELPAGDYLVGSGDLTMLETAEKADLVAAINELVARISALEGPPDLTPGFAASPTRSPITCEMI